MKILNQLLKLFFSFLFPDNCFNCQKNIGITENPVICSDCEKILIDNYKNSNLCRKCSRLFSLLLNEKYENTVCPECQKTDFAFTFNCSLGPLNGIWKDLVYNFKFSNHYRVADFIAHYISVYFNWFIKNKIIISVPDTPFARFKKGKSSVHYICRLLSRRYNFCYYYDVLNKVKKCKKQKTLKRDERYENVKNAFLVKKGHLIKGKEIVLVDDVFTTGATVNECSKILLSAGAKSVAVLTFAREN